MLRLIKCIVSVCARNCSRVRKNFLETSTRSCIGSVNISRASSTTPRPFSFRWWPSLRRAFKSPGDCPNAATKRFTDFWRFPLIYGAACLIGPCDRDRHATGYSHDDLSVFEIRAISGSRETSPGTIKRLDLCIVFDSSSPFASSPFLFYTRDLIKSPVTQFSSRLGLRQWRRTQGRVVRSLYREFITTERLNC